MIYEAPEVLELGDALDLIHGNQLVGNDCCTCGKNQGLEDWDDFPELS